LFPACDPFEGYFDQDSGVQRGRIDPYNFPPPFRGTGAARERAASGNFTEIAAYARQAGRLLSIPFSAGASRDDDYAAPNAKGGAVARDVSPRGRTDDRSASGDGAGHRLSPASRQSRRWPMVLQHFDPPGGVDPFAPQAMWQGAPGLQAGRLLGAVPLDQQWKSSRSRRIATPRSRSALSRCGITGPSSPRSPSPKDMDCQAVKSDGTLLSFADGGKLGVPRGQPEATSVSVRSASRRRVVSSRGR